MDIDMIDLSSDGLGLALQSLLALVMPAVMQWYKSSPYMPFFNRHSGKINFLLSAIVATATTAGVSVAEGGVPLGEAVLRAAGQVLVHEIVYRKGVKPRAMPAPQEPPKS